MYNIDFKFLFIVLGLLCAVVGWASIEALIWLFSHIDIRFGE